MRDCAVLLLAAHLPDAPERRFWFTPGGGVTDGESLREAAVRELREETGFVVAQTDLTGPVATWDSSFVFTGRRVTQRNIYFSCTADPRQGLAAPTDVEIEMLDGYHWIPMSKLRELSAPVFPPGLADLVSKLRDRWDGSIMTFEPQHDD